MKIAVVNGSLGGAHGNTMRVLKVLVQALEAEAEVDLIHLADPSCLEDRANLESRLLSADGFVFATGTYWDSWGSPLQKFFEVSTALEASPTWMGKPAACVVTMHSVGGKSVLSRLQGVLCTLGLWLPPMSGFAYSLANHLALQAPENEWADDLWQLDDLRLIARNLFKAVSLRTEWAAWPVDRSDPTRRWID